MATSLQKQIVWRPVVFSLPKVRLHAVRCGELFWFLVSFILFVILGPFSAPVVLVVLFRLGLEIEEELPQPMSKP